MVFIKGRRIYTAYKFYEKEMLYKKSSFISLSIMALIIATTIIIHIIINMAEIVEIPKAYTYVEEEVKEVYKKNEIKNSRKIIADYSDFIIYSAPAVKKEEIKKEEKFEKKVEKKSLRKAQNKQKPAIDTAKPVQKEVTGSAVSNSAALKNEIAAKIVYQMERYKQYPKQARRINAEGIAKVTFSINASGVVSSADLSVSSGYSILDNAALQAAKKIIGSRVIPDKAYNNLLQVTVPVDFYLN
ncbi:MAG: energy transducer TonB [Mucispirillum sp.]|nr:energy transducer TonB [Mucispirillum sp.]